MFSFRTYGRWGQGGSCSRELRLELVSRVNGEVVKVSHTAPNARPSKPRIADPLRDPDVQILLGQIRVQVNGLYKEQASA